MNDFKPNREFLFSRKAFWIWDDSDLFSYHYYLRARKTFSLTGRKMEALRRSPTAALSITADALYQVWLNGYPLGHGPAKSAEGQRSVDRYPITGCLREGRNELNVLALSIGVGTMTYCPDRAGLIFEINLPRRTIASDAATLVQRDPGRAHPTVRRWMLPCLEYVDAAASDRLWRPARIVQKQSRLYLRRVPLPSRQPLSLQRVVHADRVRLPQFAISLRLRPYLTQGEESRRNNAFRTPAYIVTDIVSPVFQTLRFTPTLGNVTWYFDGKKLFDGSGWLPWDPAKSAPSIRLKKGANRLVGIHDRLNHFEDISLAGFVKRPVRFVNPFGVGGFQVIPADRETMKEGQALREADTGVEPALGITPKTLKKGRALREIDWAALARNAPRMDPAHTLLNANAQDLVTGAEVVAESFTRPAGRDDALPNGPIEIPGAVPGEAARVILDLGMLHHGWLAFEAEGHQGDTLIFSFFEGLEEQPSFRIQWPSGSNNALTCRLREGQQEFESFLTYGVRYIAVHNASPNPVRLRNLRFLTANCGSNPKGFLRTSDALLNRIYDLCVQTLISGFDDTSTDCPTFEQVNWNCDNRWASQADYLTCANLPVIRNSIRLFAEDPRHRGLVLSQYPSTWDNHIPLWSFHWIMWCRDYFLHSGDLQFVKDIFPRVSDGIEEGLRKIGSQGLLEWTGAWHFVDWGNGRDDDHAIVGAEQAGFVGALAAAESLAHGLNRSGAAAQVRRWHRARLELIRAVHRHLWNPKQAAYVDSIHADGSPSAVCSQTTNAMMAIYGVAKPQWAKALAQRLRRGDPRLLAYGSPFGMYYVLELFDLLGDVEAIFSQIRERWGEMALAGDTTTWEMFGDYGRAHYQGFPTRSRCHPYSAFVVKYLVKYLLGIEAVQPGFAVARVRPRPPRGVTACAGAVPTPHGNIYVNWKRKGGRLDLAVESPSAIRCIQGKGDEKRVSS